ncbi:MAG: glycosyl hydrolase family 17 protein [Myxococcota bacterium]
MLSDHVAVCYSGYRAGQSPDTGVYPSREQVLEDLRIVEKIFGEIRLYDAGPHADLVLEAIASEGIGLKVFLGAYLQAEVSNPDCPWGGVYPDDELARNRVENEVEVRRAIALATQYASIVTSVSVGNEATVSWTDHLVSVERMIAHAKALKAGIDQPITFCENHVPWMDKLAPLVPELDFISVHTYPLWERRPVEEAIEVTNDDYERISGRYPGVPVAITEAGWTTRSNGRGGMDPGHASPEAQCRYIEDLIQWADDRKVKTYLFEAFDEPWKGSDDPDEPEKHWGLFTEARRPKPVMKDRYPELVR